MTVANLKITELLVAFSFPNNLSIRKKINYIYTSPTLYNMITYIELWTAKQAWRNLPQDDKNNYMTSLGPAIQQLLDNGVQIVCWGSNETFTFNRVDYDYFAVWMFPDTEAAQSFEKMVSEAGWYNYFDQVNAMGTATSPQEVIGKMLAG